MVKAVVGSGGKTTLIHAMAQKYVSQGKKVFVTTSTHMYIEEDTLLTDNPDVITAKLEKDGYAIAGVVEPKDSRKIKALTEDTYTKVCAKADVVLVEADGSKGMPLKFPKNTEPVIYDNTDEIVVVCGLKAVRQAAKDVVFRLELAKICVDIDENTPVTLEHIEKLLAEGYIIPLTEKYPDKKIKIYIAGDGIEWRQQAEKQLQCALKVPVEKL